MGKRGREVHAIEPIDRERKSVVRARTAFAASLGKFLAAQTRPLAEQITTRRNDLAKMSAAEAKKLAEQIVTELDLADWAALVPEVEKLLLAVSEDGIRVAFDQIGWTPTSDILEQVNQKAVEFAHERAAELVGMRYNADGALIDNPNAEWAISDSTRDMLRSDVQLAIEEGMSTDELASALEARYAFSEERAQTVARTELASADVEGNLMAYRDSGVVAGKQLVLGSEHEDIGCECEDAEALGVVDLDDDFGGMGDPPLHPNCVCDVLPVLEIETEPTTE